MSDIELRELINKTDKLHKRVVSKEGTNALKEFIKDDFALEILVYLCSEYNYEMSLHPYRVRENKGFINSNYDDLRTFTNNIRAVNKTVKNKIDKLIKYNLLERNSAHLYKVNIDEVDKVISTYKK